MAIAFARARYISRSSGGSAVRSAAYNAREGIRAERTGALYYFAHRDKPEHHEVLLPDGASAMLGTAAVLWNAAEAAERRKDAQLAREIVLALPANAEVTIDDRIELARRFALENFVSKGLAVQLDVHAPHAGDTDAEGANWHAHLLITTRRIGGEGFAAKKARDLEPDVRRVAGRAVVSEGEAWGEVWRDLQNRYFAEVGIDLRVDPTGAFAQAHIGPIRMRAEDAQANARADEVARANAKAARDPDQVLLVLTRNSATFTVRDLERHLAKHIADAAERNAVKDRVLGRRDVLALHDRESGEAVGRYTTKAVREQELRALADAASVRIRFRDRRRRPRESRNAGQPASPPRPARGVRVRHRPTRACGDRGSRRHGKKLHALCGSRSARAQRTGGHRPRSRRMPSHRICAARAALPALLRCMPSCSGLKNGLAHWPRDSVVIVDEAPMLDSRITGELMAEAKRAGAKLILAGDDRQLASIERGGLFAELKHRHGSVAMTEVTRQRQPWQRQAARDLADGRFEEALRAFAREKAITWTAKQDEALAALVAAWRRDTASEPERSRFVFAYTNKDVDRLNAALRQVRVERGELRREHRFDTTHGIHAFAVGDRVQFTDTLKSARIYNGNAGTVTAIDGATGVIRARLDAPAGATPREVVWSASEFAGFRHGYAGTIYKGQGKTLDQTYLLHTHHWRRASAYVALTRQRERAQVFVATETARDLRDLARQMSRGEVKSASVAYATLNELNPEQRERVRTAAQRGERVSREAERPSARNRDEGCTVMIPAFSNPQGRDSFGRGLDEASVRAAVHTNSRVMREREEQLAYVEAAYRDPRRAKQRLDELVARDGPLSAARRITAEPTTLGELQGRTGLLAGAAARAERARAETVAGALADNVRRVAEAEALAEQAYRRSVEEQRRADAVPIPALSERALAALQAIGSAHGQTAQAEAYEALRADRDLHREVRAFTAAVERRFGADGVRAITRAEGQAGASGLDRSHLSTRTPSTARPVRCIASSSASA